MSARRRNRLHIIRGAGFYWLSILFPDPLIALSDNCSGANMLDFAHMAASITSTDRKRQQDLGPKELPIHSIIQALRLVRSLIIAPR
jgi:hypothetical protein